jgi:hypothetical protein
MKHCQAALIAQNRAYARRVVQSTLNKKLHLLGEWKTKGADAKLAGRTHQVA